MCRAVNLPEIHSLFSKLGDFGSGNRFPIRIGGYPAPPPNETCGTGTAYFGRAVSPRFRYGLGDLL